MVDVLRLGPWTPGLNMVAVTQALRDGGYGLKQAMAITERVLDGETVEVAPPSADRLAELEVRLKAAGLPVARQVS